RATRVSKAIEKGLESGGTDAVSGRGDKKNASPHGLKHSKKIYIHVPGGLTPEGLSMENCRALRIDVPAPTEIAGATADALRLIGCDPIRGNDRRSIAPLSRTSRDSTTFVQRVYLLINILTTFFAWGFSHP